MNTDSPAIRHLAVVSEAFKRRLPKQVREISNEALGRMRGSFTPFGGKHRSGALRTRSGNLQNALTNIVTEQRIGAGELIIESRFGVNRSNPKASIQATVHEFGKMNIRARFADKLLIPIGPLLDARGVPLVGGMRGIKPFWDIAILPDVILGRRKGSTGPMVPIAIRKESVDIKARPFARPRVDWAMKQIAKKIGALVADAS